MSNEDFLFDANRSEQQPQSNEELRNDLEQIVNATWTNRTGETYMVSKLDVLSSRVRATIRKSVEVLDPESYAEYIRIRNEGLSPGQRPTLAQSRKAYRYLAQRFVDLTYNIPGS